MPKTLRIPLRKHPGLFFLVDDDHWAEYLRLGFSQNASLDSDGGRHTYVRTMAWLPDPSLRRSKSIALARIIVSIDAIRSGCALDPKGWTVRYKNDNRLDLRRKNLVVVPSTGQRNSYYAFWTVHARTKIAQAGGDPERVFAESRRAFRNTHKDGSVPPTPGALPRRPGSKRNRKGFGGRQ